MLKFNVERFQISMPVSDDQWQILMDWDKANIFKEYDGLCEEDVVEQLEAEGAYHVDWCGHFGQFVFFTCDADFETDPKEGLTIVKRVVSKLEELFEKELRWRNEQEDRDNGQALEEEDA